MTKWDLMTSLRYDFHRFTTDELERRGFSQTQGVSRVSLSVGLSRSPADEPPRPLDRAAFWSSPPRRAATSPRRSATTSTSGG